MATNKTKTDRKHFILPVKDIMFTIAMGFTVTAAVIALIDSAQNRVLIRDMATRYVEMTSQLAVPKPAGDDGVLENEDDIAVKDTIE